MPKTKNVFQKITLAFGIMSFISAIACIVGAYLKIQSHSINDPVAVAFLAATFFFISVGAVLIFITNANIPSFSMQTDSKGEG